MLFFMRYERQLRAVGLLLLFFCFTAVLYGNLTAFEQPNALGHLEDTLNETANNSASEAALSSVGDQKTPEPQEPESTIVWAPLAGEVKQGRGWVYEPLYGEWYFHTGQDLAAEKGQLVQACLAGEVTAVGQGTYGLTVEIQSGDYKIRYAALEETFLKPGQKIRQGQALGTVGVCSQEPFPHVHMEVTYQEQWIEAF